MGRGTVLICDMKSIFGNKDSSCMWEYLLYEMIFFIRGYEMGNVVT